MYKIFGYFSILGICGVFICEPSKGTQVDTHQKDAFHAHHGKLSSPQLTKKHTVMKSLNDILEEGTRIHPINQQNIDQARKDLEALNIYKNPSQIIDTASSQQDSVSLGLVGAAYANNFRITQALPWLFASAKRDNPDSLWLLSSLYRKKMIESQDSKIADQLKERAFKLKGSNAEEYFGEK